VELLYEIWEALERVGVTVEYGNPEVLEPVETDRAVALNAFGVPMGEFDDGAVALWSVHQTMPLARKSATTAKRRA